MRIHKLESNAGGKLTAQRAAVQANRKQAPVERVTLGIIVGNRGFFPGHLARTGRDEMLRAFADEGIDAILLGPDDSAHGAVESRDESKACAALFRKNADKIAGVVVTLPNFGDERAIAETLRLSGLNQVIIWLGRNARGESLIDFDRPVSVWVGLQRRLANQGITPNLSTLLDDLYQRGDRQNLYLARIDLDLR